jgi:hypothetical protein
VSRKAPVGHAPERRRTSRAAAAWPAGKHPAWGVGTDVPAPLRHKRVASLFSQPAGSSMVRRSVERPLRDRVEHQARSSGGMTANIPCSPLPLIAPAHDKPGATLTAFSLTGKAFFAVSLVYVPLVKHTIGIFHAT